MYMHNKQDCVYNVVLEFLDSAYAQDEEDEPVVEDDIGKAMDGSKTDDEAVQRYVNSGT